jgi:hypothetical protein
VVELQQRRLLVAQEFTGHNAFEIESSGHVQLPRWQMGLTEPELSAKQLVMQCGDGFASQFCGKALQLPKVSQVGRGV